jgi:hypothetical protein
VVVSSLTHPIVDSLANTLVLGAVLEELRSRYGAFDLVGHWTQGEFHHDVVLRVEAEDLPGPVLVVATNCNGGVKEVLCFTDVPERKAVWALRCPGNPDFDAAPAIPLARSETLHWFDPCELLSPDARSEYRAEHRIRQDGGGWMCAKAGTSKRAG